TVLGDTGAQLPGVNRTAHIFTKATNIGTGFITVNVKTAGAKAGTSKKSGCAVSATGAGGWVGFGVMAGLLVLRLSALRVRKSCVV
ncbi:MAG TPA: hypothetical protein VL860_01590, partial [Planctomycetota bacterium]|nr:hypothetical protein [Planctomycetota bacterium]